MLILLAIWSLVGIVIFGIFAEKSKPENVNYKWILFGILCGPIAGLLALLTWVKFSANEHEELISKIAKDLDGKDL